jgi:uncharacterized protein YndB with AHSA1/START domain
MMTQPNSTTTAQPELVITRTFDAPRDLVFKLWTDPEHLKHWGSPKELTVPVSESDIRPGGKYRVVMRAPDGSEYKLSGTYREIVPPERIVFTHAWDEDDGKPGPETLVTVTFEDAGKDKTKLTLHQTGFASVESRDAHREGWNSQLDNLAEYAATVRR